MNHFGRRRNISPRCQPWERGNNAISAIFQSANKLDINLALQFSFVTSLVIHRVFVINRGVIHISFGHLNCVRLNSSLPSKRFSHLSSPSFPFPLTERFNYRVSRHRLDWGHFLPARCLPVINGMNDEDRLHGLTVRPYWTIDVRPAKRGIRKQVRFTLKFTRTVHSNRDHQTYSINEIAVHRSVLSHPCPKYFVRSLDDQSCCRMNDSRGVKVW